MAGWRDRARALKREVLVLYFAVRDPRTPLAAKIVAGLVVAYALSPIDLIPDFIPVLGYLDDLILVPLGIALCLRLIPEPILVESRLRAATLAAKPRSYAAAALIIALWLSIAAALLWWVYRLATDSVQ
jgi:uncharacterized membrane protein YkvA (DUF1232 family)